MKQMVFITGVTGTMGSEGFKQLLEISDKFNIATVVLPTAIGLVFFIHPFIVDFDRAYSLLNSAKLFPALYRSTIVFLNS